MTIIIKASELNNFLFEQMRSGKSVPGTQIFPQEDGTIRIEVPSAN